MIPPNQCLETRYLALTASHYRLKVGFYFASSKCTLQIPPQADSSLRTVSLPKIEYLILGALNGTRWGAISFYEIVS